MTRTRRGTDVTNGPTLHVRAHPRDREPEHKGELHDVASPDGADAVRLQAVIHGEAGSRDANPDEHDVPAGVAEGHLVIRDEASVVCVGQEGGRVVVVVVV